MTGLKSYSIIHEDLKIKQQSPSTYLKILQHRAASIHLRIQTLSPRPCAVYGWIAPMHHIRRCV